MTHDKLKMLILACVLLALITVAYTSEAVSDSAASAPPTLGTMQQGSSSIAVQGIMGCYQSGGLRNITFSNRLGKGIGGLSAGHPDCSNPDSRCRTGFGSGAYAVFINTETTSFPSGTTTKYYCMK